MVSSPTAGYRFVAKNLPMAVAEPNERPDFYAGPLLPEQVRVQVLHVLMAAVGIGYYAEEAWEVVRSECDYEMGTANLGQGGGIPNQIACGQFIRADGYHETLDVIGLALRVAEWFGQHLDVGTRSLWKITMPPVQAVSEINRFFQEANVPWQFERGQWVHVSSGYIHQQVARPALDALDRRSFAGALQEFEQALQHVRNGNTKGATTEAAKALESTIKCICDERGWNYPSNATAKPLFDVLVARGFADASMEAPLLAVLPLRNKAAAHGQGPNLQPMPAHRAQLAVNLAATSIVALLAAYDAQVTC